MKSLTFKAKIVAEVFETPEVVKGGLSIAHILAMLATGRMMVTMPPFIDEPTILLKEKRERIKFFDKKDK